jgi:hypothetical protein
LNQVDTDDSNLTDQDYEKLSKMEKDGFHATMTVLSSEVNELIRCYCRLRGPHFDQTFFGSSRSEALRKAYIHFRLQKERAMKV